MTEDRNSIASALWAIVDELRELRLMAHKDELARLRRELAKKPKLTAVPAYHKPLKLDGDGP